VELGIRGTHVRVVMVVRARARIVRHHMGKPASVKGHVGGRRCRVDEQEDKRRVINRLANLNLSSVFSSS
jgi:hypothetical protein